MNRAQIVSFVLLALVGVILLIKVAAFGVGFREHAPIAGHRVTLSMMVEPTGDDVAVRAPLPNSDARQDVSLERSASDGFAFNIAPRSYRVGVWTRAERGEPANITYSSFVVARSASYPLDRTAAVPAAPTAEERVWLRATRGIQVGAREVRALLASIPAAGAAAAADRLTAIHAAVREHVRVSSARSAPGDARGAAARGRGTEHAVNRLYVALLRAAGIPARLVSGVELTASHDKAVHHWVEAKVGADWVPCCLEHDLVARLDAAHLETRHGDLPFVRAENAAVEWRFEVEDRLRGRDRVTASGDHWSNTMRLWTAFDRVNISLNLLAIIVMIPLGATIVALFRNIVGIATFGTFLPALIAVAYRHSGPLYGVIVFVAILLLANLFRLAIERLHLLHTARLAATMSFVVAAMLGGSALALHAGSVDLAYAVVFPVAILTLTTERYYVALQEDGVVDTLSRTFWTLSVSLVCYAVMNARFLQLALLTYPELMLAVLAANLLIGSWSGLRLGELIRFRKLLFSPSAARTAATP